MRKLGQKSRHGLPDMIDDGHDVVARSLTVRVPIRNGLVEIQNGVGLLKANLVEEEHLPVKLPANELLMIQTHRHRKVSAVEKLLGESALNMP